MKDLDKCARIVEIIGIGLFLALGFLAILFSPRADGAELQELVSDAWNDDRNDIAGIIGYLSHPIPVATNVVQIERSPLLVQAESAMNQIATAYVDQDQLDAMDPMQKFLAVDAAINNAVNNSLLDSKSSHIANGVNLLKLRGITEELGGGFSSPWYRQLTRPQTNITYQTRWQVHQGTNSFPTVQAIKAAISGVQ